MSTSFAFAQHRHGIPVTSVYVLHHTPRKSWLSRSVYIAFLRRHDLTVAVSGPSSTLYNGLQALQTSTQRSKGVCAADPSWRSCWGASSSSKLIRAPQCLYGDCFDSSSGQKAQDQVRNSISDVSNCHSLCESLKLFSEPLVLT